MLAPGKPLAGIVLTCRKNICRFRDMAKVFKMLKSSLSKASLICQRQVLVINQQTSQNQRFG